MKRKEIDWAEYMDTSKAYTAGELADAIGIHVITCRRHLRYAYFTFQIARRRKGRFWLYALPDKDSGDNSRQLETG